METHGMPLHLGQTLDKMKREPVCVEKLFALLQGHCYSLHGARWRRLNLREKKVYVDEKSESVWVMEAKIHSYSSMQTKKIRFMTLADQKDLC